MMRSLPLAAMAVLCLAGPGLVGPAWAVDSGLEVQVNPVSATGREVLLYPGGQYMRVVPALREPGDTGAPIRLHMPTRRARVASMAPAQAEPQAEPKAEPAPRRPAPRTPRPAPPPRVASVAPKPAAPKPAARSPAPSAPSDAAGFSGGPGAASLFSSLPTVSAAPNTQLASAAPPKEAPAGTEGLAKQGQIFFAHDADTPAETAIDSIRLLAGQLNNSLTRSQSRVELMAYGGTKGDKGSDARRLSLKRALSIRQALIDSGVSSARIDVHAQGGVDDTGPADRVDVYIRS